MPFRSKTARRGRYPTRRSGGVTDCMAKNQTRLHPGVGHKERHPKLGVVIDAQNISQKAGLNCGRCVGCRNTAECARWKIHRFRATYTTTILFRHGTDVRTVMSYTGHADTATVLRYFSPAEDPRHRKESAALRGCDVSDDERPLKGLRSHTARHLYALRRCCATGIKGSRKENHYEPRRAIQTPEVDNHSHACRQLADRRE